MKSKWFLLSVLLLASAGRTLADDVRFSIPSSSVQAAIKTLLDARAVAFYGLGSGFGVQNYNVKLIYSEQFPLVFQFLPNNRFRLSCGVVGRANINYIAGNFDVNGQGAITVEGQLEYVPGVGQVTLIGSVDAVVYVDVQNVPTFILNMIGLGEFAIRIPELRLGTYALVLPNISSTYFTSTSPSMAIIGNSATWFAIEHPRCCGG
jgi:hypothetical protein